MKSHKEELGVIDGICVDCEKFYECVIREAAEDERKSHIIECTQFIEDCASVITQERGTK